MCLFMVTFYSILSYLEYEKTILEPFRVVKTRHRLEKGLCAGVRLIQRSDLSPPPFGFVSIQGAVALQKRKEGPSRIFMLWTIEVHHWSVSCCRVGKDTTAHPFVPVSVKVRFRLHSAICLLLCLCHV